MEDTLLLFNIENLTRENDDYRHVISTSEQMQLVLMSIPVGEEIGLEKHLNATQFIRIEQGSARIEIGATKQQLRTREGKDGLSLFVPAGFLHNVINIGKEPLKLYTLYAPPQHKAGLVQRTKPKSS
jgi:mannose-6-phosphate isomerase-like protein (cupin superfamily)